MSGAQDDGGGDDRDLQAAEYVIGLLPPNQARALEALALSDASVAASIVTWETRLAPLAETIKPVPPPPEVWQRLELATGVSRPRPMVAVRPARPGLWRSLGLWRATTIGSLALAASLAFLLLNVRPEPLTAVLTPGSAPSGTFLVRVEPSGVATVTALGDISVPQGRSLQLWGLAAGARAPVSLGLLPPNGRARLDIPLPAGSQLLVSQEQAGGSPTQQPTTTPIFAGRLLGI